MLTDKRARYVCGKNTAADRNTSLRYIWEIDAARGLAVILMSVFHLVFDLAVYYGFDIDYSGGFWGAEGRTSAILFMLISGISSTLSRSQQSLFKRAFVIFGAAILVTVASIPVMGENYIRFGVLHFFASMMFLKGICDTFIKNGTARNILAAVAIPVSFYLGSLFSKMTTELTFLFPLGILHSDFSSFDYYPIFSWGAYFAAGALIGGTVYKDRNSLFSFNPLEEGEGTAYIFLRPVLRVVCFLGRRSLAYYLIHQPVFMALLYAFFSLTGR